MIGILGGTFDPIHNGHLLIAEQALEQNEIDEVWFVPAYTSKSYKPNAYSVNHRFNMLQKAIEYNPNFKISSIDIDYNEWSYSVDTMKRLTQLHIDKSFAFLVGSDVAKELPSWVKINDLLAVPRSKILILLRLGANIDTATCDWIRAHEIRIITDIKTINISSTLVRKSVSNGLSINYLVPKSVADYIEKNGLYSQKKP